MLITDSISFNVRERGRKFLGKERDFDTAARATLINGPAVQEKVKHGDMLGYYGHWPRLVFGMAFCEGGIDPKTGKAVALPAAVRTTELHAEPDGTITHRAEFLDTEAGQIAEGLYKSKAGGFSSAIDAVPRTSPIIPRGFHGFDFVYEPNFTHNRGHKVMLDSALSDEMQLAMLMDSALAHASHGEEELLAMFDSLHSQHGLVLDLVERLGQQNDELLDRLAKQSGKDRQAVLDSILLEDTRISASRTLPADITQWTKFKESPLARVDQLPSPAAPATPESNYALQKYGFGG